MEQVKPTHKLMRMSSSVDGRIYSWQATPLWAVESLVSIRAGGFSIFHLPVIDIAWGADTDLITFNILKEVQYGTNLNTERSL